MPNKVVTSFLAAVVVSGLSVAGCSGDDGPAVSDAANDVAACVAASALCSGVCVNTQTDNANCGACATACASGEVCSQGKCATSCGGGTKLCGSICAEVKNDPANCGECGTTCSTGEVCSNGTCATTCGTTQTFCGGDSGAPYCANTVSDNANCGGCGVVCGTGQVCTKGVCANGCASTDGGVETLCAPDGGTPYCASTQTDNANCGVCGTVCGTGLVCENGTCANACAAVDGGVGTLCSPDGGAPYCASTDSDNLNCGTCGTACSSTQKCVSGKCSTVVITLATSYAATKTFADFDDNLTDMGVSWDGTNYWVTHGGDSGSMSLGQYDSSIALLNQYSAGLDFRSSYVIGTTLYARAFGDATIYMQTTLGTLVSDFQLSGGSLDDQASVVYDATQSQLVENNYGSINLWDLSGAFVTTTTLSGFGTNNESSYPQGRNVAVTGGGIYLTYNDGTLSAWVNGVRVATTTLTGGGTSFDSDFSMSYANGLVWVVDIEGGTWSGYDIGL